MQELNSQLFTDANARKELSLHVQRIWSTVPPSFATWSSSKVAVTKRHQLADIMLVHTFPIDVLNMLIFMSILKEKKWLAEEEKKNWKSSKMWKLMHSNSLVFFRHSHQCIQTLMTEIIWLLWPNMNIYTESIPLWRKSLALPAYWIFIKLWFCQKLYTSHKYRLKPNTQNLIKKWETSYILHASRDGKRDKATLYKLKTYTRFYNTEHILKSQTSARQTDKYKNLNICTSQNIWRRKLIEASQRSISFFFFFFGIGGNNTGNLRLDKYQ